MARDDRSVACEALAMCAIAHLEKALDAAAVKPRRGLRSYRALAATFAKTSIALASFAQAMDLLAGDDNG